MYVLCPSPISNVYPSPSTSTPPPPLPLSQQIGFDQCVAALGEMVVQAKKNAGIDPSQPLESLVRGVKGGGVKGGGVKGGDVKGGGVV